MVNHPEHVRHIMKLRDGEYSLLGPASWVRHVLGASMQMMEGEEFRQRRKVLTPMFGRAQLAKIAATVADEYDKRLARWERFAETGERVDLQHEINGVVIPPFMRAMSPRN